ncbi:Metal-dependent hydrolases of the beta-lactamase superfamily I; PhnP protein [hydrothermal vent metagenome]|uniref:Metal-dependent hydrolases of the beta-lactamase superfamily I PhnP protein n=1 Tax=hydrothermal vent metagenome TaxID=652676 RepID=A0A3B1C7T8_9ZZZZ
MGKLTFLGTGTSSGVPLIGCFCKVCASSNLKDKRLRSSVWIEADGQSALIDTATDLRQQALRAGITRLDAVFFTHHHADHVHGIDELRSFNFLQNEPIACYGKNETLERIRTHFAYIFNGKKSEGGGKPNLELRTMTDTVNVGGMHVTPVPVEHGALDIYGYLINKTAYITDCSKIPQSSMELLAGLDTLILGALGLKRHNTHFTLEQALCVVKELAPQTTYLTHLNHNLGHDETSKGLPSNVHLAWDGLSIDV